MKKSSHCTQGGLGDLPRVFFVFIKTHIVKKTAAKEGGLGGLALMKVYFGVLLLLAVLVSSPSGAHQPHLHAKRPVHGLQVARFESLPCSPTQQRDATVGRSSLGVYLQPSHGVVQASC